jgi:hypothetical protein
MAHGLRLLQSDKIVLKCQDVRYVVAVELG